MHKRHDKLSPHPPTISKIQRHCETTLYTFFVFPCCLPLNVSHENSAILHNYYYAFLFYLLNAIILEVIISDLLHLIFISYLAYRNGPVKVPQYLALPIAVHLARCCQLHLPWAWHSHAQKQANKCPKMFHVFFCLFFFFFS